MAGVTECESCPFTGKDDLEGVGFPNNDESLLLSLLEDSQMEEGDDERLKFVMQSLEAEIVSRESCLGSDSERSQKDCQFSDADQMDGCSTSSDQLDFEWVESEMDYYPSYGEMAGYYLDYSGDKMEHMNELLELRDYSQICYGMAAEDEEDYGGLWQ